MFTYDIDFQILCMLKLMRRPRLSVAPWIKSNCGWLGWLSQGYDTRSFVCATVIDFLCSIIRTSLLFGPKTYIFVDHHQNEGHEPEYL